MEVVAQFVGNVLNGGDVGVVLSCVFYGGCYLRFPLVGKTLLSTLPFAKFSRRDRYCGNVLAAMEVLVQGFGYTLN